MRTKLYKSWSEFFRTYLDRYVKLDPVRRGTLIFRGHSDHRWELRSTLDRLKNFGSAVERAATLKRLVDAFKSQSAGLTAHLQASSQMEWELLGRHHGLPATVLDFSRSPFIAAYFAFAETPPEDATYASILQIDRTAFASEYYPQVEVIDQDELLRFNPRAQEQQGLFLQIRDVAEPVESLLGNSLMRYDIPGTPDDRMNALTALEAMTISARKLFGDLDGAAKSATMKVMILEAE